MRPMSTATVAMLDFETALAREAVATRNLVPDEPGWDALAADSKAIKKIAGYVAGLCRKGFESAPSRTLSARKPGHGVRPVAFWGPADRILYRALTDAAVRGLNLRERSTEEYIKFVKAPVDYAYALQQARDVGDKRQPRSLFYFLDTDIEYIVRSDVTAFYQFVDHGMLADELIAQGASFEIVAALVELLGEIEGRAYGLPQLLDSSDVLSEVFIDRVERSLLRQGLAVWRFNDDFRIACRTYSDAVGSIELLDTEVRANGLSLNESKTFTYRFITYLMEHYDAEALKSVGGTIAPDDVEAVTGDYLDDFSDNIDGALEVVKAAQPHAGEDGIDLNAARGEEVRTLRRALDALAKERDDRACGEVRRLLAYLPSLTPDVAKYLLALKPRSSAAALRSAVDDVLENTTLNAWQMVWLLEVIRKRNLIRGSDERSVRRLAWVTKCFESRDDGPLRAAAFRTLSAGKRLSVQEAVQAAADSSYAVRLHYLAGIADRLVRAKLQPEEEKAIRALGSTDVLHRQVLGL
ncbi:MAG: hypothetical protein JWQ74_885 [Marmoricola sp.]|nr:hypothetical protein [Marmoricola sp.]